MAEWWSIEVFHADLSARQWKSSYANALEEAAPAHGALDAAWQTYRTLPAVRAALDAAPDPVNGLIVYRGRGGASGSRWPRRRGPKPSADALARPEPAETRVLHLTESSPPAPGPRGRAAGPWAAGPWAAGLWAIRRVRRIHRPVQGRIDT